MRVWIDQDLCTGDGLCVDHCPEVFVLLEDGISYVHYNDWTGNDPGQYEGLLTLPDRHESAVIAAAEDCPGECIFIECDNPDGSPSYE
jgi:ferredoxin